ncbi:transmembrane protein 35B [Folsomia candida]|uniref:Novel acetylcholine receptor chaperone n=1 Tax=Folsomia candida TaxID=158441 RepID=A0A226DAE7_FOLCA|nr:transmembrane protein 35B [Folsomia candida]OXA41707.1 Transmembrane protein 35 [Folsomia candida]
MATPTAPTSSTSSSSTTPTSSSSSLIVLKSLSILLGIFFIFLGVMKVTPFISKELHKDARKEFVKYSKVFPLSETLGFKIPSKWYRRCFGGFEIACGLILAVVPSAPLKRGVNLILVGMSLLSVYNHCLTDDKFERTSTALVLFFMTTCRLIVDFQSDKKLLFSFQTSSTTEKSSPSLSEDSQDSSSHVKSD